MTTPANNPGGSSVGQGWADTMSLDTLSEAIRLNSPSTAQQSTNTQRFWSSPARTADSTVHEVLQIDLANARLINRLSFDVTTFPHDLYVEYYDSDAKVWGPLLDGAAPGTVPVTHTVLNSVPAVLPPISSVTGHLHPQHSFSGHWLPLSFPTKTITTRSIRIVFSRNARGNVPVSTLGVPVAYSLGVRNLYVGYSINELTDVPRAMPKPDSTNRGDFAQTTDMFGSVVSFSVRVNSASNVLRENSDIQNGLTTVWKSQPQPIPWAVVNFYLDARDANGNGQVLDRIYVDPLYDGPTVNVYHSNDDPTGAFPAPSDPLPGTVAVVNNASGASSDVLHSGQSGQGKVAFVDVNNQAVSFDASHRWWIGGRLNWKFAHGTQSGNNPILSCSELTLSQTPFGLRLATSYGDTLNVTLDPFDPATPMSWVATYDGVTLGLSVRVGLVDYSGSMSVTVPLRPGSPTLRFGGFLGDVPGVGDFDLQAFVLKIDDLPDADTINDFLTDPAPYVTASQFMGTNDPRTDNALLRYSPSFVTTDYPTGFIGGTPDRYADFTWTPVARDFVLRKGFMYFSPTKAKYWKMEFTNLSPQFYEVYQPVDRVVETFPSNMWNSTVKAAAMSAVTKQGMSPGTSQSYVINAMTSTLDFRATSAMSTGVTGKTTPTQARVLIDASVRNQVGGTYWAWNFLPLHSTGTPPSFHLEGKHQYEVVSYRQTNKLAYFVGLRTVTAYRLDYLTTDDTAQIVEMFNDLTNVDPDTNWILQEDHHLSSGDATWAEVRSKPVNTNRIVTGVQFAAQQTDPVQMLAVDDFSDPTLVSWDTVGDAVLTPVTSANRTLGKTIRIDRSLPPLTWSQVQAAYPNWNSFGLQGATFDAIVRGSQIGGDAGGVASQAVGTAIGGRVYAAARVIAPADLTSPLFVQLYDDVNNSVIMESSVDVKANKITEWYCGYTLNEILNTQNIPFRWADFVSPVPTENLNDSFVRPNATTLGIMDSGQQWGFPVDGSGNPLSLAIQGNKAVVTTYGQWDYVGMESPWGTLQFSVGAMGTTGASVTELVLIGSVFLDTAGVLQNAAGSTFGGTRGNVLTTDQSARAVQANDTIRVDILPTIYVPTSKRDVAQPAGTDPAYAPYSLMFYLNGVWVRTFSHSLGVYPLLGIKGRLGQQFTSFTWTPANYGTVSGPVIVGQPNIGNGTWMDPVTQSTWIDNGKQQWRVKSGSWDPTGQTQEVAADNVAATLVPTANGSVFVVETEVWHGTITTYLRNIAGTSGQSGSAGWHGNVLCLDYVHGVYLDYQGNIRQNGAVVGTLFPSGLQTQANISIHFVHTATMQAGNRPVDPAVYPDILVGKINGVVQGYLAIPAIATWTGTLRGVAGDVYSGTRPGGAAYTLDTAFQTFNWAPDASYVAVNASAPTWDNATQFGAVTFDDLNVGREIGVPTLRARVVQKGASTDVWEVDRLSLFLDPILWYFSNDGGYTWTPALDIRNNPDGILLFPPTTSAIDFNQKPGTSLLWKCIAYKPNTSISALTIRPWYGGLLSGITHRPGLVPTGPNVNRFDHYGDIYQDARFQTWNLPIPRDWWYQFQIIARSQASYAGPETAQITTDDIVLSQTLITDPGEL